MSLRTDYKDAIPASGTLRKYKQIDNGDGTVSFQDATTYSQVGDKAQASVFNDIGTEVNEKAIQTYTHAKSGTVHALTGSGPNGKFLAAADYVLNDSFTINGTVAPASLPDGSALPDNFFKSGNWVSFIFDGVKLGFKSGGSMYGTLPAQIGNFYATVGNACVGLSWTNPYDSNFAGVIILRKTGGYPSGKTDGTKIYDGTGASCTDAGLTNGTQYYYRAFAYNSKREYQTSWCVATMTPQGGYQLGTFPVGTKLYFGRIYGNPIVFTIANKSGSDITLVSGEILTERQFSNGVTYKFASSDICAWLNSDTGFLSQFSSHEKSLLKAALISSISAIGSSTVNAKIWLLSCAEVGCASDYGAEGSQMQLFFDNNSRIARYTADCAANCSVPVNSAGIYWLRSYSTTNNWMKAIVQDGSAGLLTPSSSGGVRPCCCLDASILVCLAPDANGIYSLA